MITEEEYKKALYNLNILEQAIFDMCDTDTAREIYERKRMIQKK